MKFHYIPYLITFLYLIPQADAQESRAEQRLAKLLKQYPQADSNKDGKLSREEVDAFRKQMKSAEVRASKSRLRSPVKRYTYEEMAAVYEAKEFEGMPYRIMKPAAFNKDEKRLYPLILSLHGAGGKGSDNRKNLKIWNGVLSEEAQRKKHPCFVVAPQSPAAWRIPDSAPEITREMRENFPEIWKEVVSAGRQWLEDVPEGRLQTVFKLLDSLAGQYPIDLDRVYVVGHSMGGFGTFEAIAQQPKRFAAAIPCAGGLLPWHDVSEFSHVPVWAFHGDQDTTVPIGLARTVFAAMKEQQGNMKFTELKGVGHNANGFAFIYTGDDMGEGFVTSLSSDKCDKTSDVWDWLFAQRRRK